MDGYSDSVLPLMNDTDDHTNNCQPEHRKWVWRVQFPLGQTWSLEQSPKPRSSSRSHLSSNAASKLSLAFVTIPGHFCKFHFISLIVL